MKLGSSKKQSLEKKLALAMSLVNVINAGAPIALPYVRSAQDVRSESSRPRSLADDLVRTLYGTACAEPAPTDITTVSSGESETRTSVVSPGGQLILNEASGTILELNDGGIQDIVGGSGTILEMNHGGTQTIRSGTGTVSAMYGGTQTVILHGCEGTVTYMSGGSQKIFYDGSGTIGTMDGGTQIIDGAHYFNIPEDFEAPGIASGSVHEMNGGTQIISPKSYGAVDHLNGGVVEMRGGQGAVDHLNGGVVKLSGGQATVNHLNSGGVVEMRGGQETIPNSAWHGGTLKVNANYLPDGSIGDAAKSYDISNGVIEIARGIPGSDWTKASGGKLLATTTLRGDDTGRGVMIVSGGGLVSGHTIIHSGGTQIILDGGTVIGWGDTNGVTDSGGVLEIHGGAHFGGGDFFDYSKHKLNGGTLRLKSGATVGTNGFGILRNGTLELAEGGSNEGVYFWDVAENGVELVNGGKTTGTHVYYGGRQIVRKGTATSARIDFSGTQTVEGGGTAVHTLIENGGTQVLSGSAEDARAFASDTTVIAGTQIIKLYGVASGGTIGFNKFSESVGSQIIEMGGTAIGDDIGWKGEQTVSGGTAIDANVTSGGTQIVKGQIISTTAPGWQDFSASIPGYASGTTVGEGGTQIIDAGGVASGGTVSGTDNSNGIQLVLSGGTAIDAAVTSGGQQTVSSGGTAIRAAVSSGGQQNVSSGGTAISAIVNEGGQQTVSLGGTAIDAIIKEGGQQTISAAGTARSSFVNDGGTQIVKGQIISTTAPGWQHFSVSIPGYATDTTVNAGGTQIISEGGVASGSTVAGFQTVSKGGTAIGAAVGSGGQQNVSSGGTAIGSIVNGGGQQTVLSGGKAISAAVNSSGHQAVSPGGTASGATVYSGGLQEVSGGGTAKNTHIESGGLQETWKGGVLTGAGNIVNEGGGAWGGTLKSDNASTGRAVQTVYGNATSVTVDRYSEQSIEKGGTADYTVISSLGLQTVSNGAKAVETFISGGTQIIKQYGLAEGGTLLGYMSDGNPVPGKQFVNAGGTASATVISAYGEQIVSAGGTAKNVTASDGGTQTVSGTEAMSGLALETTVSVGGLQSVGQYGIASGGTVVGLEDEGHFIPGTQIVNAGGTSLDVTVGCLGRQFVSGTETMRGLALNTTVSEGGTQIVERYGVASGGTVAGTQEISAGGTAIDMIVGSGGAQVVSGGGSGTVLSFSGGRQEILSGGSGTARILSDGRQEILSGGTGSIGSMQGGTLVMEDGAVFSGSLSGFGTVSGSLRLPDADTITASGGSLLANGDLGAGTVFVASGGMISAEKMVGANKMAFSGLPVEGGVFVSGGRISAGLLDITDLDTLTRPSFTLVTAGSPITIGTIVHDGGTQAFSPTGVKIATTDTAYDQSGTTIEGQYSYTVAPENDGRALVYTHNSAVFTSVAFGEKVWGKDYALPQMSDYKFASGAILDASKLSLTINPDVAPEPGKSSTTLLRDAGLSDRQTVAEGKDAPPQAVSYKALNGAALSATMTGHVAVEMEKSGGAVKYFADSVTLTGADLAGWNGETAAVPTGWTARGFAVATDGMKEPDMAPGKTLDVLTAGQGFFSNASVEGAHKYAEGEFFTEGDAAVSVSGHRTGGVRIRKDSAAVEYVATYKKASGVTLGKTAFAAGTTHLDKSAMGYDYGSVASVDASGFSLSNPEAAKPNESMTLLKANDTFTATLTDGKREQDFTAPATNDNAETNGVQLSATLSGTVSAKQGSIRYTADSVTLDAVDLRDWDGKTAGKVPDDWRAASGGVTVNTGMAALPAATTTILTAGDFSNVKYNGGNEYGTQNFTEGDNGVALSVTQSKGVKANDEKTALVYEVGRKNVSAISLGAVRYTEEGVILFDGSAPEYDYGSIQSLDTTNFSLSFTNPLAVAAGENISLLEANDTLRDFAEQVTTTEYRQSPVAGVTFEGVITGRVDRIGNDVGYMTTGNRATKLAFGDVDWKDTEPLITRSPNVVLDGAKVDTTHINFRNFNALDADKKTMLVEDFGDEVGTITGDTYTVGSGLMGMGKASLEGRNLVFTTETGTTMATDQTHGVVMSAEAGMAALAEGNAFIGSAADGLALAGNAGADGVSTFAKLGGGSIRQETGSHVNVNTWNAILALGRKNEKEKSSFEYGAFFEYGSGNFTTHDDGRRGDGSTRYTGGGVLAKWTAKHGFYVEGSLRAGNIHDDARNVLRDVRTDEPHSYETDAGYFGAHVGIGKEIELPDGNVLDVYGKYFHNRRNGVSFDAGANHYDLGAVTSSILRVGACYVMKREKWNFYGGLSYEHEFDGKAAGTVSAGGAEAEIRGADIGGGSFRAELGATMKPSKDSPWSLDLNLAGFAGKKQGFSGGVSVAWTF